MHELRCFATGCNNVSWKKKTRNKTEQVASPGIIWPYKLISESKVLSLEKSVPRWIFAALSVSCATLLARISHTVRFLNLPFKFTNLIHAFANKYSSLRTTKKEETWNYIYSACKVLFFTWSFRHLQTKQMTSLITPINANKLNFAEENKWEYRSTFTRLYYFQFDPKNRFDRRIADS